MSSSSRSNLEEEVEIFKHARGVDRTDRELGSEIASQMVTEAITDVNTIPMCELLDADSRPSFILDLDPDVETTPNSKILAPVFYNSSLRSYESLREIMNGETTVSEVGLPETVTYEEFRTWAVSVTPHDASRDVWPTSFLFCGMIWTGCTVRRRFRTISGNRCYNSESVTSGDLAQGPPPELATGIKKPKTATERTVSGKEATTRLSTFSRGTRESSVPRTYDSSALPQASSLTSLEMVDAPLDAIQSSENLQIVADWTVANPIGELSEHVKLARSIDWGATSLGAMETWSAELRQIANLVMLNPHPIALFYGTDLTMMYNEGYRDVVAGIKHPALLGTGFQGPFSELWDDVGPLFAECRRTGKPISMTDQMLPMVRFGRGYLEETYFSWCFVPMYVISIIYALISC